MEIESRKKRMDTQTKAMVLGIAAGVAVTILRNPPFWGAFLRFFLNLPF